MSIDAIFLVDVGIKLRTSVITDGMCIVGTEAIFHHYLQNGLMRDLIAAIPFGTFSAAFGRPLSAMQLRLVRALLPLLKTGGLQTVGKIFPYLHHNPGLLRLVQMMLLLLLACHWTGCAWFGGSLFTREASSEFDSLSWKPSPWLLEQSFWLRYAHAFVWGASITTSFSTFSVQPQEMRQVIVTVFAMFFGLFTNTIIISSATTALQEADSKQLHGRQKLEAITTYLRFRRVPPSLTHLVTEFFEFQMQSSSAVLNLLGHDFKELPPSISLQLTIRLHKELLTKCPLFLDLPAPAALKLVRQLKPQVFAPSQVG